MGKSICDSTFLVNDDNRYNIAFNRIVNTNLIAKINTGLYGKCDRYYIRWKDKDL